MLLFYGSSLVFLLSFFVYAFSSKVERKEDAKKEEKEERSAIVEERVYVKPLIRKEDVIYNALVVYPELEDYLFYKGAKAIKNPIVKKAFTKKTTFSSLAKALGKEEDEFVNEINEFLSRKLN